MYKHNKKVFTYNYADLKEDMKEIAEKEPRFSKVEDMANFLNNADGIRQDILNHIRNFIDDIMKER